jgi:hypothetical protein
VRIFRCAQKGRHNMSRTRRRGGSGRGSGARIYRDGSKAGQRGSGQSGSGARSSERVRLRRYDEAARDAEQQCSESLSGADAEPRQLSGGQEGEVS